MISEKNINKNNINYLLGVKYVVVQLLRKKTSVLIEIWRLKG